MIKIARPATGFAPKPIRTAWRTLLPWFAAILWSPLITASCEASALLFTHNSAGRLTVANYASGKSIAYAYDNAGNLTQRSFTVGPAGDSDNDGMDDAWETAYFMTLARDGSGDYDLDGMSDLAEFLAGTLPNSAASLFKIIRVTPLSGASAEIEWTSVPGKTYHVQYKNSLNAPAWSDLPGDVTASGATASTVDNSIAGAAHRVYRVVLGAGGMASPPFLSVSSASGSLAVSWPSSTPAGFSLETATNLTPPAVWFPVTNVPSNIGTNKVVNLNINPAEPAHFYRLKQ